MFKEICWGEAYVEAIFLDLSTCLAVLRLSSVRVEKIAGEEFRWWAREIRSGNLELKVGPIVRFV
jgi:hypothetical protein